MFFALARHQPLHEHKLITKGVIFLANTAIFNQDIQDWQRLPVAKKTWQHFKTFSMCTQGTTQDNHDSGTRWVQYYSKEYVWFCDPSRFSRKQKATNNFRQINQGISNQQNQINKFA